MKLPADSIIAREKLSAYLLSRREDHDKSGFLAVGGYELADAARLETDLRTQLLPLDAEPAGPRPTAKSSSFAAFCSAPTAGP